MLKLIGYTVEERMTSGNLESIFKVKTIDEARRYVRKIIVSDYKEDLFGVHEHPLVLCTGCSKNGDFVIYWLNPRTRYIPG